MLSTEGFFRKSTFCTFMDVNSGFGGHAINIFTKYQNFFQELNDHGILMIFFEDFDQNSGSQP